MYGVLHQATAVTRRRFLSQVSCGDEERAVVERKKKSLSRRFVWVLPGRNTSLGQVFGIIEWKPARIRPPKSSYTREVFNRGQNSPFLYVTSDIFCNGAQQADGVSRLHMHRGPLSCHELGHSKR